MRNLLAKLTISQTSKIPGHSDVGVSSASDQPAEAASIYGPWEALIPPRALWVGPTDPVTHFLRWPIEYRAYLTLLCGMRQDASVLELGCNHGRTMLGLVDYLRPPGRYEGLDILPEQIEFAQKNIHAALPIFNFTHADIQNRLYNPQGKLSAESYRFPYDDGSFDVVYAASLFTHLLPAVLSNYLKETKRVLRQGGCCLFSFFLLENYRGPGTSVAQMYQFDYPLNGSKDVAVHDPEQPEQVIAYTSTLIGQIAADAGLKVRSVLPGYWSKAHDTNINEQDLVVLESL